MSWIIILLGCIYISICILYAWFEGRKKATGFIGSLLILLVLPFIGTGLLNYFLTEKPKVVHGGVINITKQFIAVRAAKMITAI